MEINAGYCVGKSAGRLTSKGTITPEKPGKGYARRGGVGFVGGLQLNEQIQAWSYSYNQERPHQNLGFKTPDNYEVLNQKFYFSVVAA